MTGRRAGGQDEVGDRLVALAHAKLDVEPETRRAAVDAFARTDADVLHRAATEQLQALSADDPQRRLAAAETLYALVSEGLVILGLTHQLVGALEDPATKWAAGALMQEIAPTTADLQNALTADEPRLRLAGARYCELREFEDAPAEALREALVDPEPDVRAATARAFRRAAMPEHADLSVEPVDELLDAATDDDPVVRANATIAAVRLAFHHDAGDPKAAADTLVDAAIDDDTTVREHVASFADVEGERLVMRTPDAALSRLVVRLAEADAAAASPTPLDYVPRYCASWHPEIIEPVLDELLAIGWDGDGGELAREVVASVADDLSIPTAPLSDALADGVGVVDAVAVLTRDGSSERALADVFEERPVAATAAVDALADDVRAGDPDACTALEHIAAVAPEATMDALGPLQAKFDRDAGTPAGREDIVAPARAVLALADAGVDVPAELMDVAATRLREALATPDQETRQRAGEALETLGTLEDDPLPVAQALSEPGGERTREDDWEPLSEVATADPEAASDLLCDLCQQVLDYHDGDDRENDPRYEVQKVIEAAVRAAPVALAPAIPTMARALDVTSRGYRETFGAAIGAAAFSDPEPLLGDPETVDRLVHHLFDVRRNTRTGVATALRTVGKTGGSLPAVARPLVDVEPSCAGWPLGPVAEEAPTLGRRAVRNAEYLVQFGEQREAGWLLAEVARSDPVAVMNASPIGAVEWLADRTSEDEATGAARALAGFADAAPELVPEDVLVALTETVVAFDRGDWAAAEALRSVATADPETVADVLSVYVDDPDAVLDDAEFRVERELEPLFSTLGFV